MSSLPALVAAWVFGNSVRVAETVIRRTSAHGHRVFFDPSAFAWAGVIERDWQLVRAELDTVLADRARIPNFQDVSDEQRAITQDDRWKVFVFSVFGTRIEENCKRCPDTTRLLERIPGLCNAMFSILAPRKQIPEHRGPYCGLLRYHLALKVPASSSGCSIRVKGIERHWGEGQTMIFDDSFVHSVDNATDEERVVLFADFERPLPALLAPLNRVMIAGIARSPLARQPIERFANGEL